MLRENVAHRSPLRPALPLAARLVVILFLIGAVIFLGYWFHTKDQLVVLAEAEQQEQNLRVIFEKKAEQAANLEPVRAAEIPKGIVCGDQDFLLRLQGSHLLANPAIEHGQFVDVGICQYYFLIRNVFTNLYELISGFID